MTKSTSFHWNHRVVEYPKQKGERHLAIHEAHYYPGRKKTPNLITLDAVGVWGGNLKELRETLERMLRALDKPILKYRKYVKKEKKKK